MLRNLTVGRDAKINYYIPDDNKHKKKKKNGMLHNLNLYTKARVLCKKKKKPR